MFAIVQCCYFSEAKADIKMNIRLGWTRYDKKEQMLPLLHLLLHSWRKSSLHIPVHGIMLTITISAL